MLKQLVEFFMNNLKITEKKVWKYEIWKDLKLLKLSF